MSNKVKVWYKFNNEEAVPVEVGGNVASIKIFIMKEKWIFVNPDDIHVIAPGSKSDFYSAGLPDDAAIPDGSSQSNPILVRVQQESMQMPSQIKKAKLNYVSFEQLKLTPPTDVEPPRTNTPVFVAQDGWLEEAKRAILRNLQESDHSKDKDDDTIKRVPPMAVVRCSRGGKTRALYEIANAMRGANSKIGREVAALYVSFSDYSSLQHWEQEDPLQALLRRIVFIASHGIENIESFDAFIKDRPIVQVQNFLNWLGDTPCILLVDELNNPNELTESHSAKASEFGRFLKRHFIGAENRCMVFSSHALSTLEDFAEIIGPKHYVELLDLPLANTLPKAQELNNSLESAREPIYYGLLPGMIYESAKGRFVGGKRDVCTAKFIKNSNDLERDFISILDSLITGDSVSIPADLHILLDSTKGAINSYGNKIRWVPLHLSFVLDSLGSRLKHPFKNITRNMVGLCESIKTSKNASGEGWEALFVLILLARCLAKRPDDVFVPYLWFEVMPNVSYNNYPSVNAKTSRLFSECKTWEEVKEGLKIGKEPQISIIYPTHSNFAVYDVVVVYSKEEKIVSTYGYQLKEGKPPNKQGVDSTFTDSFFVQGKPPKISKRDGSWYVPSKDVIDAFYGESGKYWTPECWHQFIGTGKEGYLAEL